MTLAFRQILTELLTSEAEFIVVGGVAAVIQAVPVNTFDVDIVHKVTPDNIERLLSALSRLDAYHVPDPGRRRLPPTASHLGGGGHCQFQTTMASSTYSAT